MRALALRTVLSFALAASSASAVTLTVNSTADDLTAGDGQCTLREAIINANTDSDTTGGDCPAGSGADEIVLPAGNYVLSIEGRGEEAALTGDLDITDDLTLTGAGANTTIVDAARLDHVFSVDETNVEIRRTMITGGWGIGIAGAPDTALTISDSIVSDNWSSGVLILGTAVLTNTEVSDNLGGGSFINRNGGGLWIGGSATLTNSTVSRNTADLLCIGGYIIDCIPGKGGGIYLGGSASLVLISSTLAENIACEEGPQFECSLGPGSGVGGSGSITLINSVLDNVGGDCDPILSVTSGGHNIDSDGSCGLTDPTDLPNTDPMLGPLQDNGGWTQTHALQLGSPAIDAIAPGACSVTRDQRGVWRPADGDGGGGVLCDIGAYEVTKCADGLDNDGDGRIDFDGGVTAGLLPGEITAPDPQCRTPLKNREMRRCGLGFELALMLAPLGWIYGRPRRRLA